MEVYMPRIHECLKRRRTPPSGLLTNGFAKHTFFKPQRHGGTEKHVSHPYLVYSLLLCSLASLRETLLRIGGLLRSSQCTLIVFFCSFATLRENLYFAFNIQHSTFNIIIMNHSY